MANDMKVLLNHIYEFKKGVRQMVLYTFNKKYQDFVVARLHSQQIPYIIQPVGNNCLNLFFGRKECLDAIRLIITKPLNQLSPEEDFILGAMLGCSANAIAKENAVYATRYNKKNSNGGDHTILLNKKSCSRNKIIS